MNVSNNNTKNNTNVMNTNAKPKKKANKVFKKKQVSFKTIEVFGTGFKTDVEVCFCIVSKLLFRNVINIDGSIDMEQLVNVQKKEIWSYIYYMYQYNNATIPEFIKMKNPTTGKADGQQFYNVVFDDIDISNETNGNIVVNKNSNTNINSKKIRNVGTDIVRLVYFINKMVHTYKSDLINPVVDYLKQLMKKEVFTKLSEIKVNMVPKEGFDKNVHVAVELMK